VLLLDQKKLQEILEFLYLFRILEFQDNTGLSVMSLDHVHDPPRVFHLRLGDDQFYQLIDSHFAFGENIFHLVRLVDMTLCRFLVGTVRQFHDRTFQLEIQLLQPRSSVTDSFNINVLTVK